MPKDADVKLHVVTPGPPTLVDPKTGELVDPETVVRTMEELAWEQDAAFDQALTGTEEMLSFDLGSEYSLNKSTVKVGAVGDLRVEGQYKEGDRIKLIVEVEVEHVSFPPVKHKGYRVGTERRHHTVVIDARQK